MKDVLNCKPASRVETGSIRKISRSLRFLAASRKKSFHISVMSHNAEVKLRNLCQFAEAFNGIACCKRFRPTFMFQYFTINCLCLTLFLCELKQVLVLVKQFIFINRNVPSSRYYSHGSTFSYSVVCKRRNLVKAFKFSK